MSEGVSARLRRLVFERASGLCEYCLIHQRDAHFTFQVDHIVSRKQRGPTKAANLALTCLRCNVAKGTDPAAYLDRPLRLMRLFHPRDDRWSDHFALKSPRIKPLTDVGKATVRLLDLNGSDRLLLRRALIKAGSYPSIEALAHIRS
jgi:hypothetical protein